MKKKAVIAMSGGVDSSVAAYLMKQQGYDCIGVTMKLFDSSCRSTDDIEDARSVAGMLGIAHHVIDLSAEFKAQVTDRFVEVYKSGATPNPCVDCNRHIKFGALMIKAKELGADYLVTGHYARTLFDDGSGRYLLKKALDGTKDQSYFLYSLTQEQLSHTILPLGELTKAEIRKIASGQGFGNAKKQDSQDICFVPDDDYAGYIERYTGESFLCGDFVDMQGNILGRHKGLIRYTVGQRKGLGLSLPKPMYVRAKNPQDNTVTLCGEDDLLSQALEAADFNWIAARSTKSPICVKAKIRYSRTEQQATAEQVSPDIVRITFDKPQRAVTKGQAVVLYDDDVVIGGGTII